MRVNDIARDLVQFAQAANDQRDGIHFTAADRWENGQLIAFMNRSTLIDVFFVDRRKYHRSIVSYARVTGFEFGQYVFNRRTMR